MINLLDLENEWLYWAGYGRHVMLWSIPPDYKQEKPQRWGTSIRTMYIRKYHMPFWKPCSLLWIDEGKITK